MEKSDWIIIRIPWRQEKYHPTLSDPSTTTTPLTPSSFNLFATVIPAIPLVKGQNLEDSVGNRHCLELHLGSLVSLSVSHVTLMYECMSWFEFQNCHKLPRVSHKNIHACSKHQHLCLHNLLSIGLWVSIIDGNPKDELQSVTENGKVWTFLSVTIYLYT